MGSSTIVYKVCKQYNKKGKSNCTDLLTQCSSQMTHLEKLDQWLTAFSGPEQNVSAVIQLHNSYSTLQQFLFKFTIVIQIYNIGIQCFKKQTRFFCFSFVCVCVGGGGGGNKSN